MLLTVPAVAAAEPAPLEPHIEIGADVGLGLSALAQGDVFGAGSREATGTLDTELELGWRFNRWLTIGAFGALAFSSHAGIGLGSLPKWDIAVTTNGYLFDAGVRATARARAAFFGIGAGYELLSEVMSYSTSVKMPPGSQRESYGAPLFEMHFGYALGRLGASHGVVEIGALATYATSGSMYGYESAALRFLVGVRF